MYDIITIANKAYYPFLQLFLASLFKNTNTENIDKISIINAGGLRSFAPSIEKYSKVQLIGDSEDNETFVGVHLKPWLNIVKSKTTSVLSVLGKSSGNSLILIDCDTFVIKDFSEVINKNFDIQFTTMATGWQKNHSGIRFKDIACFTIFNNIIGSIMFVKEWIKKIKELSGWAVPPHETPAMNLVIAENIHKLSFGFLSENEVCADMKIYSDTRILHFKSNGGTGATAKQNFFERVRPEYLKYLDQDDLKKWVDGYE